MTLHLNDDQLDDLLIGDASSEAEAHLAACADCAARYELANAPLASFNAVSLAWGERRSATLPLPIRAKAASGSRLGLALGAAATAVFALALALPLLHHGSATQTAQQTAAVQTIQTASVQTSQPPLATPDPTPETQTPATQIARDNQLLQAIDQELAASSTPAELLKMAGQPDTNQSSPDVTHNE